MENSKKPRVTATNHGDDHAGVEPGQQQVTCQRADQNR